MRRATQEPSLLLSFRLRLAVQSQSRPPPALLAEAEAALLRGEMLAPEALSDWASGQRRPDQLT